MVDAIRQHRTVRSMMNPWVLHLQKLGLELKCPLCLELLKRPFLLPCDHIFCNACLPKTAQFRSECPACKAQYVDQDLRPIPFVENIVNIYRSLDTAFWANLLQPTSSDMKWVLEQCPTSTRTDCDNRLVNESCKPAWEDNSSSGQSVSLLSNKLVQVPHNRSVEHCVQKNNVADKCCVPSEVKDKKCQMVGSEGDGCSGKHNIDATPVSSQIRAKVLPECGTVQIDMNKVEQLSPGSPSSFSDIKESENDSNDQGRGDSPQNYQTEQLVKQNSDGRTRQDMHDSSASDTEEGHLRDPKRHKKLNYCPLGTSESSGDIKPVAVQTENLGTSNSQLELKSVVPDANARAPAALDASFVEKTVCGFCHSSRITDVTGPMLHFVNEKPLVGDEVTLCKAIHVHRTCVDWAPQVYYAGETVKNLTAELARGAKLKCSRCGLKGATLGCYLKSCRRSYHAPCAMQITNCRWAYEDFLMLCPAHSSLKFPNEKPKSAKGDFKNSSVTTPIVPEQPDFWVGSSNGAKEWVFCGSALSSEDKYLLVKFGSMIGVPVTKFWRPDVSHVIAATDTNGACTRTLKVLMAILNGKWVLTIDWIKACMESIQPVNEEPYEVCLDNHGCSDGPKTGRLSAMDKALKLFNGLSFYFTGDFASGYKVDLQNLVTAAGGTILKKEEVLAKECDQAASSRPLIVYNLDPPEGCQLGDEVSILWERLSEAQDLAAKIESQVIGHTWLLESVAAYKLQPFDSVRLF